MLSWAKSIEWQEATLAAGKVEPRSGTITRTTSRPGTAKSTRPGTAVRPGAGSAALAATALAANEGVCLHSSNKKDERARKVTVHVHTQQTNMQLVR